MKRKVIEKGRNKVKKSCSKRSASNYKAVNFDKRFIGNGERNRKRNCWNHVKIPEEAEQNRTEQKTQLKKGMTAFVIKMLIYFIALFILPSSCQSHRETNCLLNCKEKVYTYVSKMSSVKNVVKQYSRLGYAFHCCLKMCRDFDTEEKVESNLLLDFLSKAEDIPSNYLRKMARWGKWTLQKKFLGYFDFFWNEKFSFHCYAFDPSYYIIWLWNAIETW